MLIFITYKLCYTKAITVDLNHFLPQIKSDEIEQIKLLRAKNNNDQKMTILIGSHSELQARLANEKLKKQLKLLGLKLESGKNNQAFFNNIFNAIYKYRAGLLSVEDQALLNSGNYSVIINRALLKPINSNYIDEQYDLARDPFLFFDNYIKNSGLIYNLNIENNNLVSKLKNIYWYVLHFNSNNHISDLFDKLEMSKNINIELDKIKQLYQIKIITKGHIFDSVRSNNVVSYELKWLSIISVIFIAIIIVMFSNDLKLLLFSLLTGIIGFIFGVSACLLIYNQINLWSLLLTVGIIGFFKSFAIKYFSNVIINIFGLVLFIIGCILLLLTSFPVISQMIVLVLFGLIGSVFFVYLAGPLFKPKLINSSSLKALAKLCNLDFRFKCFIFAMAFGLIIIAFNTVKYQDIKGIDEIESRVSNELSESKSFLLFKGDSYQDILQKQELIIPKLNAMQHLGYLQNFKSLNYLLPSIEQQETNRILQAKIYNNNLKKYYTAFGFNNENKVYDAFNENYLTVTDIPLDNIDYFFELTSLDSYIGRIFLENVTNFAKVQQEISSYEGVELIREQSAYNELFDYQRELIGLLLGFIFLTFLLSIGIFYGLRAVFNTVVPVLLAVLCALAGLSLFYYISVFHLVGAVIVSCIGIVYALHLYFNATPERVSVYWVTAITTMISFGLLAYSELELIRDFGIIMLCGTGLCFLLTSFYTDLHP